MSTATNGCPQISLKSLKYVGRGLHRPECVLANRDGILYSADWRGGIAMIAPDGSQSLFTASIPDGRLFRPNGIALRSDGSFLFADLGESTGGVFSLDRKGNARPFLEAVDGIPLPPTNYVIEDGMQRIWITVSTRCQPRARAYRADVTDGFIVVVDGKGARIVADNLGYTNEAAPSPCGRWLYVNETFSRKLSRFRIGHDGSLTQKETVTTFGPGTYPDGLSFDEDGGVWITSIVSNRVIRVLPDGSQILMVEDCDQAHAEWVEQAFIAGEMGRHHLDNGHGKTLKNISSLAFGGPNRRIAYLGSLLGDSIPFFESPIAGAAPQHWNY